MRVSPFLWVKMLDVLYFYDQITLAMHVHSNFVTNSYSESSDSSHEKSWVPVHRTKLTIAVLDYILEIHTVVN